MTTHGIPINGKTVIFTEYTVKPGETTLHQIARDHLYDESRFNEIKEWKDSTYIVVTKQLVTGQVLLIPPVSDDIETFKVAASLGSNIRSAHDLNASVLSVAPNGTPFHYSKKSLTLDSNKRLWVEVRTFKDTRNVVQKAGWICVTEGTEHYTDPQINAGKPTG